MVSQELLDEIANRDRLQRKTLMITSIVVVGLLVWVLILSIQAQQQVKNGLAEYRKQSAQLSKERTRQLQDIKDNNLCIANAFMSSSTRAKTTEALKGCK